MNQAEVPGEETPHGRLDERRLGTGLTPPNQTSTLVNALASARGYPALHCKTSFLVLTA